MKNISGISMERVSFKNYFFLCSFPSQIRKESGNRRVIYVFKAVPPLLDKCSVKKQICVEFILWVTSGAGCTHVSLLVNAYAGVHSLTASVSCFSAFAAFIILVKQKKLILPFDTQSYARFVTIEFSTLLLNRPCGLTSYWLSNQ